MKKLITLLLTFLIALTSLVGFVGCKDPFNDDDLGKEEVEGKVTIQFGYLMEEKDLAVVIKREFEKTNSLINLKMIPLSGDWKSQMNNYVAKPSTFPDIVWVPSDQHSAYAAGGAFVNLRPLMESDAATNPDLYYDSMIKATAYSSTDTGIWFAPRDYNKPVTYINKKMFEAAGVAIPTQAEWNYQKFLEVCQQLRTAMDANDRSSEDFDNEKFDAGIEPNSFPVECEMQWNPVYHGVLASFGARLIDTSKTGEDAITVDDESTIQAYEKIYNDLYATGYSSTTSSVNFLSKKAAMWFNVRPKLPTILKRNIEVDFLPLPFEKIGAGNSGYAITSVAKDRLSNEGGNTKNNQELAWEVIKWLITEPGQQVLGQSGTGVPVLKSMANSGDWISKNDPTLNHAAFTAYEERDIELNVFNIYQPTNHKVMFDTMTAIMTKATSKNSYEEQGGKYVCSAGFLSDLSNYKAEMKKHAK